MDQKTIFSEDRKYRYTLWRDFESWINKNKNYVVFIGLNPSTADETKDDPTIRRCMGFTKQWGFGSLCMLNLFAYRTVNPEEMKRQIDPIGPDNDKYLLQICSEASLIIAAWGTQGNFVDRDKKIMALIPDMKCLSNTKNGFPQHPLYVRKNAMPFDYNLCGPLRPLR